MRLIDLKKVSPVSVHFATQDEIMICRNEVDSIIMEGSLALVKSDKDLFSVVASAMQFPEYFGHNWDALDECLGDMDWLPGSGYVLVLRDATKGWSQSSYVLGRFVTSWLEANEYWMEQKTPFHLVFIM